LYKGNALTFDGHIYQKLSISGINFGMDPVLMLSDFFIGQL
jgi:hypothetical protein